MAVRAGDALGKAIPRQKIIKDWEQNEHLGQREETG